jgi:hypothetical protein
MSLENSVINQRVLYELLKSQLSTTGKWVRDESPSYDLHLSIPDNIFRREDAPGVAPLAAVSTQLDQLKKDWGFNFISVEHLGTRHLKISDKQQVHNLFTFHIPHEHFDDFKKAALKQPSWLRQLTNETNSPSEPGRSC